MEDTPILEDNLEPAFEAAYDAMLATGGEGFVELDEVVPKVDFLRWLVAEKGFLLHGSNNPQIPKLEPRLANCAAKEFGNQEAVFAMEDAVLPMFYAIKDRERFEGTARSGFSEVEEMGGTQRVYAFAVSPELLATNPWSDGAVYVLPRETFVQGHDDVGAPIDEWASTVPVQPVGRVAIAVEDFPYFDDIEALEE